MSEGVFMLDRTIVLAAQLSLVRLAEKLLAEPDQHRLIAPHGQFDLLAAKRDVAVFRPFSMTPRKRRSRVFLLTPRKSAISSTVQPALASALTCSGSLAPVNVHLHRIDDLVVIGEVFVVSHAETVWTGNGGVNSQTWPKSDANVASSAGPRGADSRIPPFTLTSRVDRA
jgi:hypothetical protein